MIALARRLYSDCRGLGATEFALIVPFMLFLWAGLVELTELHIAGRKATVAAQSAADLIAQEQSVSVPQLEDIVAAVNSIMSPYPTQTMGYDIASVEADIDGNVSIGWRFTRGAVGAGGGIPPRALTLVTQNESVIVAVITYQHRTTFNLVVSNVDIAEEAYARPRRVRIIPMN